MSSYDVLTGALTLDEAAMATAVPGLSIVPSTLDLLGVEMEIAGAPDRVLRLRNAVQAASSRNAAFTYVLIDCPPSLNLLTLNSMAAADSVLVPLQCEFFALEGLSQLLETVEQVRNSINPDLTIQGIVLTMFDGRNNLARQVVDDVRAAYGRKGLRDGHSAQCPDLRGAVLRQAGNSLRSQMFRQPGLSAARLRGHPPGTQAPRSVRLDSDSKQTGFMMNDDQSKKRLGRGLAALIGEMDRPAQREEKQPAAATVADGRVPIEFVSAQSEESAPQLRREPISTDLAQSIREHGIVQPVLVQAPAPTASTRSSPASGAGVRRSAPA